VLRDHGVAARHDGDAAEEYVRLRAAWDGHLAALAEKMAHEWDERVSCPPTPMSAR
jgi:hypothetical protein